jgi:hypothetical protein
MDNKNLENNIKEYFDQRTIQPSESAWERLDFMLDNEQNKPSNTNYYWLAGILGVLCLCLIVGFWLRNVDKIEKPIENKVNKTEIIALDEEMPIGPAKTVILDDTVSAQQEANTIRSKKETQIVTQNLRAKHSELDFENVTIPEINQKSENESFELSNKTKKQNADYELKINAAKLLANVEQEMSSRQTKKLIKIQVDPKQLLAEAEKAAEASFLQKMYKNIQDNAGQIIVVVSNRNFEDSNVNTIESMK